MNTGLYTETTEKDNTATFWSIAGSQFPNDELFNARQIGIQIGMQQYDKIIQDRHIALRNAAFKISKGIYGRLKEKFKIEPLGMRMRTEGFSAFGTLFMLKPDDFYSETIEGIYEFLNEERKSVDSAIEWSFAAMPASNNLDESAIKSDGYILAYGRSA